MDHIRVQNRALHNFNMANGSNALTTRLRARGGLTTQRARTVSGHNTNSLPASTCITIQTISIVVADCVNHPTDNASESRHVEWYSYGGHNLLIIHKRISGSGCRA